ncbi:hypothetical protein C7401_13321 [Paraburkholderia unamae]|nr:hypothetical protein C7401_13321 [Paraburkholderia unamae]
MVRIQKRLCAATRLTSVALTRDDVLDNITLNSLTNTGISAARFYWESHTHFAFPLMSTCLPQ